ncbi:hypothetical protein ABZX40_15110 [Streptomyces sp. NPDC004610]|uniref:hypothetical protein n=1 Tax=unclassified Streptomyces TaxID=2593676 RepID=UPI0033AA6CE2
MYFGTRAVPKAETEPELPLAGKAVTLIRIGTDGVIAQTRLQPEKQAVLAVLELQDVLLALRSRQDRADTYTVEDRARLLAALHIRSGTADRAYFAALEAGREREAAPLRSAALPRVRSRAREMPAASSPGESQRPTIEAATG